jgi:transcriptional regulator with XRE-family HTH domain
MTDHRSYLKKTLLANDELRKEFLRIRCISDVADQIILLRDKKKISQSKLAELAGTTQTVISRIENGSVNPSIDTIQRIADALDSYVKVNIISYADLRYEEILFDLPGIQHDECTSEDESDRIYLKTLQNFTHDGCVPAGIQSDALEVQFPIYTKFQKVVA